MIKKNRLSFVYLLPMLGDLTNAIVGLLFIIFAVSLGLNPVQVGFILSAYGITYMFVPLILGRIIDSISRRKSLIIATIGQIICGLFYIFIFNFSSNSEKILPIYLMLLVGQILRAIAYSFYWPSIEAFLSEISEHDTIKHEKTISNFCLSWSFGAAIGPVIAGLLGKSHLMVSFMGVLIIYCTGLIIVIISVPIKINENERKNERKNQIKISLNNEEEKPGDQNLHKGKRNNNALILFIGTLVYAIGAKLLNGYFPNYAIILEGLSWSESLMGTIMTIHGIGMFSAFYFGRFLKNSKKSLGLLILILSGALIPLIFFQSIFLLSILLFSIGFILGRLYYISLELTLKNERYKKGTKAGIFESLVGLGTGISPIIAGYLSKVSLTFPFLFISFLFLGFFIIIHMISRKNLKKNEN